MEMQGNATEIDERNLLQLDALLSHGYGLSPQLVMRSKGLSIEAKALYGYLSSFAGAGDTAFPSTSRILEELDISKNRFYKIRKELVSWGFISIETTATSAGLRTVYTLPQNPIAIKTEIDEIANRRNEIKSSLLQSTYYIVVRLLYPFVLEPVPKHMPVNTRKSASRYTDLVVEGI